MIARADLAAARELPRPLVAPPLTLARRSEVAGEVAAAYAAGCSLAEIAAVLRVDGRHLAYATVRALLLEGRGRPRPVGSHGPASLTASSPERAA